MANGIHNAESTRSAWHPISWVRELGGLGLAFVVLWGVYQITDKAVDEFARDMRALFTSISASIEDEAQTRNAMLKTLIEQNTLYEGYLEKYNETNFTIVSEMSKQTDIMQKRLHIEERLLELESRIVNLETPGEP